MRRLLSLLATLALHPAVHAQTLELKPGDHVCLVGNTLPDRMQHFGWLETLIQARFPQHQLVFRNLGYSGDEVAAFTERPDRNFRMRSMDFGTSDQWLAGNAPVPQPGKLSSTDQVRKNRFETTNTKADVIFAFFGYNESFAGEAGLPKFKQDLESFIKHTLAQRYNGKSAPHLVLFGPIAHEYVKDPNLPDGAENTARLKLYSQAMAEVARAQHVPFVDLFGPSQTLYAKADKPLTINGVHLNENGDRQIAEVIDAALFGEAGAKRDARELEQVRTAVNDKNFYWFNRYRTVDGYSTYGDRAFLKFTNGQSNYEVVQRELEALDVMTSNRDKVVWAAAQGRELKPDDSNLPPFIPVITNKPGPLPGGKHVFLGGEEEIQKMTLGKGLTINLFADEKMFPELAKPVQMSWDTKGRLWVAVWPTYPHWKPTEPRDDKLLILEDTDGDGKADKCTVFADHLHCPTGFEFYNGGVLVAQAPDLMFLKASDGGDKADIRQRVIHGLDSADTHHTSNSFALDPGGAVYFQEGTFHHSQVETAYGPPQRLANAGVFRYEPRTQKFDVYVTFPFANPHGHVFNRWGQDIVVDGTGSNPFDAALFSGYLPFPQKHNRPPQVYQQRTRPCPGIEILSSRHFPDEFQGNLLVGNVIFPTQGILRYKIEEKGSSFSGTELEPIVSSTDPNFRPSDIKIGPDGAIYFLDWQNPIIGHMQHNLRDPNRDREHGRIYRVTYEGRPLDKPGAIAAQPLDKLLDLLKEPEDRVRYRTRIELGGRKTEEVLAAARKWMDGLDPADPHLEHHLLEALWLHQAHNVVNVDLLKRVLASPDFHARAAGTRVLCYWRDRVAEALPMLKRLAADPHPRVRLEAARAASYFTAPDAIEVPLLAAEQPMDEYIAFVYGETMRVLQPLLRSAVAKHEKINFSTELGPRYLLRTVSLDDLLKMERTRVVSLELLYRPGVRDENRRDALRGLARLEKKNELNVLMEVISTLGNKSEGRDEGVAFDLIRLLSGRSPAELAGVRGELERLATSAQQPVLRQVGYVALINIDGNADRAWALAVKSAPALRDLLAAMPLIADAGLRAGLYPKVEPLLAGLPPGLAAGSGGGNLPLGRFVRIELPGRQKTLTLAEVEVFSDDQNIARKGKATQKNTAFGGDANKAIDGNKSGNYSDGGQSHTEEGTANPWWELDLGAEFPISSIAVWNRTDGGFGPRLANFTIRMMDKDRRTVFERKKVPAPELKATFELGTESPQSVIRREAMVALTSVRGQEQKTFQTLAQFVRGNTDRLAAIRAMQRIPRTFWPKEDAAGLLDIVLAHIQKIPAAERTTPGALDALEFADGLASLLPPAEAKRVRAELGELGVRVIRLQTLPERMAYDKELLVVKAGKPVEILFENTDLMPHNFVITLPGAMEEIGKLAEGTAQQPDAPARHFVPKSGKILLASTLLQPRDSQRLSFTAPKTPGVYPYVCTYPGHWLRMHGALYVVADLDEYQANPEAYLAKNPLEMKDELLKDRRPRTEWKFEDLAQAVAELKGGRSYGNGKHLFQVATCVACHKLDGAGNEYGPDLAKLEPKLTPVDILKDIVEPSFRINEKYQSYVFDMKNGKSYTGIILEEKNGNVTIIENPLANTKPVTFADSQIETRTKSPVSIMPKGLLDKLTREEILDLIAYIACRGNKEHGLFRGEAEQHGRHH
jgi:putative heme-binding domain-containing protein